MNRVFADSGGGNVLLLSYAGEVLEQCEICCASDNAPHVTIAGTPTVAMFYGKLQVDSLFLDDTIACMRWMSSPSSNSLFR